MLKRFPRIVMAALVISLLAAPVSWAVEQREEPAPSRVSVWLGGVLEWVGQFVGSAAPEIAVVPDSGLETTTTATDPTPDPGEEPRGPDADPNGSP